MDLISLVATFLITFVFGLLLYFKRAFAYWKRKRVPYIEPRFPFGTIENPATRKDYIGIRIKKQYDQLKSKGHKHGGLYFFARPCYLPIDTEYIKNIMSKDFQYFVDRGTYYNEKDDPLSAHLFNIEGQKWRNLRAKLTPTFTSGKMKTMFHTIVAYSDRLIEAMAEFTDKREPVDIKDILGRFTTDIIGSCAFGLDCNSFKDPDSEFKKYGQMIFSSATLRQALRNIIAFANPKLGMFLGITINNSKATKFFMNVVEETVKYRETTNFTRKDFMQILIDLKNNVKVGDEEENGKHNNKGFTIEEIAAQAFVFFLAGYETSSTTMAFCLYELAMNPEIQDRLREEINQTFENQSETITYEGVMEMKYLSQVVDETLRKYPPGSLIPRICVEDYQIPNTDIIIDKGTRVLIPALALHHDPEYYPDPDVFDPERFNDENKKSIHPFTYIPFGEGPRICIGLRFGLMQAKVGLAFLLKHFKFSVNKKTNVPLIMDPFTLILSTKDGIWLDVEKI
ncbi:hypothetical protein ILUMI_08920 [Ignelater luminosus]|uniref:Cytochrome P450 n=1 Tax=Ignelater luminosus TaxID=2038154 RepID=A0A8K0GA68_IGNLU|nr:hypothetical protein ILUMI_08920 [Ignelater luminosus]